VQQRIVDKIEAANLPHYELKELERASSKPKKFRTEREQSLFTANERIEAILKQHLEN
jgi:hypothetical protein